MVEVADRFARRLRPARADLAARSLEGAVESERFCDPVRMVVTAPVTGLSLDPAPGAALDTELLFGEPFDVYDISEGLAWGQSVRDGYCGHVPHDALGAAGQEPTHRVATRFAQLYPRPDMKTRPIGWLPHGARLAVEDLADGFARIAGGGHVPLPQLAPLDRPAPDWVAEAEAYLGVPYLWGGRSALGLDCSALVQLARQSAGYDCPRDSDMQEAWLGRSLEEGEAPRRGDLIFWKGHVGVMLDARRLLHANAHAMAVTIEDLAAARTRIEAAGDGPATRRARLEREGTS